MTTSPYGQDRWIGSIEIITGLNDALPTDAGTFILPPGRYWAYMGVEKAGYPSFYKALFDLFGFDIFAVDVVGLPAGSPIKKTALTLDGGGETFDVGAMHPSLRPLFGFGQWQETGLLVPRGVSPYSIGYQWLTPQRARDKRGNVRTEHYSVDSLTIPEGYTWREEKTRSYRYGRMPAAVVRESRAREAAGSYANYAALKANDTNNNWERIWRQGRSGTPLLVIWDEGEQGLELDGHPWEAVVLIDPEQRQNLESTLSEVRLLGESYSLEIRTRVIGTGSGVEEVIHG